jgi:hypothetical protein
VEERFNERSLSSLAQLSPLVRISPPCIAQLFRSALLQEQFFCGEITSSNRLNQEWNPFAVEAVAISPSLEQAGKHREFTVAQRQMQQLR